jgi:Family of unknown function (DUF5681)
MMAAMTDDQRSSRQPGPVGYGRPPVETRFRKGQSGNPNGRPRNADRRRVSARLKALLREEALRHVPVDLAGERMILPAAQAAIRSLALSAARGRPRELRMFLDLMNAAEVEDDENEAMSVEE